MPDSLFQTGTFCLIWYSSVIRMCLFLVLDFFELSVEGFERKVDRFLKGVGCLVGHEIVLLGDCEPDDGLFVEGGLRFHDLERDIDGAHSRMAACQSLYLLVDEFGELLGDVEVDGFDVNVHNFLLFCFVHEDVRVGNYF